LRAKNPLRFTSAETFIMDVFSSIQAVGAMINRLLGWIRFTSGV